MRVVIIGISFIFDGRKCQGQRASIGLQLYFAVMRRLAVFSKHCIPDLACRPISDPRLNFFSIAHGTSKKKSKEDDIHLCDGVTRSVPRHKIGVIFWYWFLAKRRVGLA